MLLVGEGLTSYSEIPRLLATAETILNVQHSERIMGGNFLFLCTVLLDSDTTVC